MSWLFLDLITCISDAITFQICSVLSGKLNSPTYLQENKCTSYCLLEDASWAVWFFFFSRLAVILFWQLEQCFTLLSFFTLSKEFLVHSSPSAFPCLLLSVWISALKQWLPLICIAGLQHLVLQRPELNLPNGKVRSNLGHQNGQRLLPWVGHAGEVVGVGKPPMGKTS